MLYLDNIDDLGCTRVANKPHARFEFKELPLPDCRTRRSIFREIRIIRNVGWKADSYSDNQYDIAKHGPKSLAWVRRLICSRKLC